MKGTLYRLLPALLLTGLFAACDDAGPATHPAASEPACSASPGGPLPAWQTAAERAIPGKADEWDDYRAAHPEWFGLTAPPVVQVRPFAEYEPTQAVMLRPSGNISSFHRHILEGLVGHVARIVIFHVTDAVPQLQKQLADWGLDGPHVEFVDVTDINANWTRDYGPLSVVSPEGRIGLVDFRYYHGRAYDDAIPGKLADAWGIHEFRPSMSYEGGNFMADPHGTCYATEKIYQQNAGYPKDAIDQWMLEYMGCRQIVTYKLPKGLGTGHVDMFSKLMDDGTVLLGSYDPALQPANSIILDQNEQLLEAVTTEQGESLEVIRLPLPWDSSGIWYTYTNSLIVNDVVLIPVYSKFDDLEVEALAAYAQAAPELAQVTINADSIIPAGGAIHCVTMSVPVGALEPFQEPPTELCHYNDYKKCEGADDPCGGLALEGTCDGQLLRYCGADGYPHTQECAECCAWDPAGLSGNGWYDCLAGGACEACTDACAEGSAGCSHTGSHTWECTPPDRQGCRHRAFTSCAQDARCNPADATCIPAVGACADGAHLCDILGSRTCADDGVVTCVLDATGCRVLSEPVACPDELACFDGVCAEPLPEPHIDDLYTPAADEEPPSVKSDDGCCSASPAGAPSTAWLLAALLALLAAWRRAVRTERSGQTTQAR